MRLVATGLSTPGYVTVATTMGLENVFDHAEGFVTLFDRERGRDPGLYYLRCSANRARGAVGLAVRRPPRVAEQPRRRRHARRRRRASWARPAVSPLLLEAVASTGRWRGSRTWPAALVRSLRPGTRPARVVLDRAPSDVVTADPARRAGRGQGGRSALRGIFRRQRFPNDVEPGPAPGAERRGSTPATGYAPRITPRLALHRLPQGLPASRLDAGPRDLLRALLATYLGRVPRRPSPSGYSDDATLDAVHLAWAGRPARARRHYRLQARGC